MSISLHPEEAERRVLSAELAARNQELERYAEELERLREIGIAVSSTLDSADILRIVCEGARRLFDAPYVAATLPRPDARAWECGGPGAAELLTRVAVHFGDVLAAGETVAEELIGCGEDECVRAVIGVPLRQGAEIHGALLLGWDTPRVLSMELVRLAETLGVHVAVSLQNARLVEEMRGAALRRDRFFSAISHDLRTPITAIVGYSELLLDGVAGELCGRQQEMVERISQVSAHLSQLVGDILDLTRLDAGRVEFHREPTALDALVEEALVTVEPQARAKGLALRPELRGAGDRLVPVDRFRVRQVLVNLLSNAVKFTESGEVCVSAGCGKETSWIAVRDTGPGIPAGSEEVIFEEFLQLANSGYRKAEPGSGLGLAIARRLARAMGGDLLVESTPGNGAHFTLHLPHPPEQA